MTQWYVKELSEASQTLKTIVSSSSRDKSLPWETIMQLIEVYRMTQQLEKTWAGKIFTPEELKDYANFEHQLRSKMPENTRKALEKGWDDITLEVQANLEKDPNSAFGIALGKRAMDWVNSCYGKEYVALRNAIWEKGLKTGKIEDEKILTPEGAAWLDTAISAYYRGRTLQILNQVGTAYEQLLVQQWEALLTDMHGDEQEPREKFFDIVLNHEMVSETAKEWVRKYIERKVD